MSAMSAVIITLLKGKPHLRHCYAQGWKARGGGAGLGPSLFSFRPLPLSGSLLVPPAVGLVLMALHLVGLSQGLALPADTQVTSSGHSFLGRIPNGSCLLPSGRALFQARFPLFLDSLGHQYLPVHSLLL